MPSDKIINKYKEMFIAMEEYDKTRELPFHRKRIDLTLSLDLIRRLKEISRKKGIPISRIIEEKMKNLGS